MLIPTAAGALFLAARRRLLKPASDERGIALQTIIIIVVLLAIAGAVTAVLLTTAGQATQEAENVDVTTKIDNEAECNAATLVGSGTGVWASPNCTFTASTAGAGEMSASECTLRGGAFTPGTDATPATNATCVVKS